MHISIRRTCEADAPLGMAAEAGNDWTHFCHLHRRSHVEFRLLHKEGNREIFLYKARILYPFPFFKPYLAFREYAPEQMGYRQIYLDLKTGQVHFLSASHAERNGRSLTIGEFCFSVSGLWRIFPKLFYWIFKLRMKRVMDEDAEMLRERMTHGHPENKSCAPETPASFDFFESMSRQWPKPAIHFEDFSSQVLVEAKA